MSNKKPKNNSNADYRHVSLVIVENVDKIEFKNLLKKP